MKKNQLLTMLLTLLCLSAWAKDISPKKTLLEAFAISEWQNCTLLAGGVSDSKGVIARDDSCFVYLNSEQEFTLWVHPVGFYSKYRSGIDLHHKAFGFKSGGEFTLRDHLILGADVGYLFSGLYWTNPGNKGHCNTFLFEPYAAYLLPYGIVELSIMGMRNSYNGKLAYKENGSDKKIGHSSWDLGVHLEGTGDIKLPKGISRNLSLHPHVELTLTNIYEDKYGEVKSRSSSLLYSLISVSLAKVLKCSKEVLIKPNLSVGWVGWNHLNSDRIKVNDEDCKVTTESQNQLFLGVDVVSLFEMGVVISLRYHAYLGDRSPIQLGEAGLEWNW